MFLFLTFLHITTIFGSVYSQYQNATYVRLGCYNQPSGTSAYCQMQISTANMTNQLCAQLCSIKAYNFAITYASSGCCCMSSLDSTLRLTNDSYCNSICSGNSQEYCGSSSYYTISLYGTNQTSNYTQNGQCALYRNTVSAGYQISSQGYTYPTIDLCISWCSNMSMNYAVLFTWCYCSMNLSQYFFQNLNTTYCGSTCFGNSTQYCGGSSTFMYTVNNITSFKSSLSYAEYQGTYSYSNLPMYFNPSNYYQYSILDMLRSAYLLGYEYAAMNSIQLICISNITAMTKLSNSTSPNRLSTDYSYANTLAYINLEVYRIKLVPSNYNQSTNSTGSKYLGCYQNSVADAVYETTYLTNQDCIQFCAYLNYSYAATRLPRCYCGYTFKGLFLPNSYCNYLCSDSLSNCGGSAAYFSLYQILGYSVSITCSSNRTTVNTTVQCQLTIAYYTNANISLDLGNGSVILYSNLTSECQTCNNSFFFNVSYPNYGTYMINASAYDMKNNRTSTSYIINVPAPTTTTTTTTTTKTTTTTTTTKLTTTTTALPPTYPIISKGGSIFKKYPNSDMYYMSNNIISSSFQPNKMKCGRLCYMSLNCTSFVYKTNQNCTIYITTSNDVNLLISDSLSNLYIKIA